MDEIYQFSKLYFANFFCFDNSLNINPAKHSRYTVFIRDKIRPVQNPADYPPSSVAIDTHEAAGDGSPPLRQVVYDRDTSFTNR